MKLSRRNLRKLITKTIQGASINEANVRFFQGGQPVDAPVSSNEPVGNNVKSAVEMALYGLRGFSRQQGERRRVYNLIVGILGALSQPAAQHLYDEINKIDREHPGGQGFLG